MLDSLTRSIADDLLSLVRTTADASGDDRRDAVANASRIVWLALMDRTDREAFRSAIARLLESTLPLWNVVDGFYSLPDDAVAGWLDSDPYGASVEDTVLHLWTDIVPDAVDDVSGDTFNRFVYGVTIPDALEESQTLHVVGSLVCEVFERHGVDAPFWADYIR